MSKTLHSIWLLCLFALMSGCGYQLAGKGSALPAHLNTIAVEVFANTSSEPEIQRDITEAIRRGFLTDGRLGLTNETGADLLMKGTLNYYSFRALAFDRDDVATEYSVVLGVEIEILDMVKDRTFLKQKLSTQWDYRSSGDIADSESARQEALREAYRDLANRLVSLVIDQF